MVLSQKHNGQEFSYRHRENLEEAAKLNLVTNILNLTNLETCIRSRNESCDPTKLSANLVTNIQSWA